MFATPKRVFGLLPFGIAPLVGLCEHSRGRTQGLGRTHADWQPENWASEGEGTRASPQTGAVTFAAEVVAE